MKIGILTFHWATNYGAVLQTYALQTYLESKGHEVFIINYKPQLFDHTLKNYIFSLQFLRHSHYVQELRKEKSIDMFRKEKLHLTKRVFSYNEIPGVIKGLDAIISGSDQVLNPSFLMNGEGRRVQTPVYFLDFKFEGKKIAYAVSFGCTDYPASALPLAKKLIHNFDIIGVRESSGIEIVKSLGRNDAVKVPDPTLLLSDNVYYKLSEKSDISITANYTYCFFIRNIKERIQQLNDLQLNSKLVWNNDDGNYLINDWLRKIRGARLVITDSFHCVVMCLKMHVPFVAVTEKKGKVAMNDRLFSLLTPLQLENYIIHKSCLSSIKENMAVNYRWESVDSQMVRLLCDADEFLSL